MTRRITVEKPQFPYCPGCTHTTAALSLGRALENLGIDPLDIIVVTDIGCCGLIDPLLECHTIHGLHGRSAALGMGIRLGLANHGKKVIVIQGDGGATIGLQHLLEAARVNSDLTLIVQNNMVYGMTGGQVSGLSSPELKERRDMGDSMVPPYDIIELAHTAGASYATRVLATGDLQERLEEALLEDGFALVEIEGLCQPYGAKSREELESTCQAETVLRKERDSYRLVPGERESLLESLQRPVMRDNGYRTPGKRLNVMIAGSAGEGVQAAASLLATAGISAGLKTSKKGEYPITVGRGYSRAEVILSPETINFTVIEQPDVVIAVSEDGLQNVRGRLAIGSTLVLDTSLSAPKGFSGECLSAPFREIAGWKGAALCALAFWLEESGTLPVGALEDAAGPHKHAVKLREAIEASRTCRVE